MSIEQSRIAAEREGLIFYQPSNGTEFEMFKGRCERCRHYHGYDAYCNAEQVCDWKILDRLVDGVWREADSQAFWFDPADLRDGCPAECLRFTDKNDPDGERRDPPKPDCEGQMFFNDLDVPVELPAVTAMARKAVRT